MKDQLSKIMTTLIFAAIATTLVIPRSGGQSVAKAIQGYFEVASKAASSTLGVTPRIKPTAIASTAPQRKAF